MAPCAADVDTDCVLVSFMIGGKERVQVRIPIAILHMQTTYALVIKIIMFQFAFCSPDRKRETYSRTMKLVSIMRNATHVANKTGELSSAA